jgi:hypothetical protein
MAEGPNGTRIEDEKGGKEEGGNLTVGGSCRRIVHE